MLTCSSRVSNLSLFDVAEASDSWWAGGLKASCCDASQIAAESRSGDALWFAVDSANKTISEAPCAASHTHSIATLVCPDMLFAWLSAYLAATSFDSAHFGVTQSTNPIISACSLEITPSSKYIRKAVERPTITHNARLSMKRGFTPRGKLPKLSVVFLLQARQSATRANATPPPSNLPWIEAYVGIMIIQMSLVIALCPCNIASVPYSCSSCRPPVQKWEPAPWNTLALTCLQQTR